MPSEIQILNGSSLRERALREVAQTVQRVFSLPVSVERADLDLADAFDESRKQNNSTVLLAQILNGTRDSSSKRLAVVDVDLFIPVLTFVFGEAQLLGPAAIVSMHRLSNPFYGLPRDDKLMLQRLAKESVNELRQTFGLYHCHHFECVMRSSTYVEEIDMKRVLPCAACSKILAEGLR